MTRTLLLSIFLTISTLGAVPHVLKVERGTPDEPFEILQRDWTVESLRAIQGEAASHVWAEGDVLNFLHVSPAASVMLVGSIQAPMKQIDDSDFWVLSVRIPGLSKAVIGYAFLEAQSRSTGDQYAWRGVDAPAAVPESATLEGKVLTEKLWMDGLEEHRDVSVYLPPGHEAGNEYAVIYMGDGDAVERYARMIEPLIESGEIPKTIIVGVHSGGYRGEHSEPRRMEFDYRAIEYLVGADEMMDPESMRQGHFQAHERFFTETVRKWAEREYGVSSDRMKRGIFGVSSGASFAVTMAQRHADLYGFVLPFSLPWSKAVQEPRWSLEEAPRHYFVAGLIEPHDVYKTTKDYAEQLKSAGYQSVFKQRLSGHDALMWREEFGGAVRWALSAHEDWDDQAILDELDGLDTSRTAEVIIKELDAADIPAFDASRQEDRPYVNEYLKVRREALGRRAILLLELNRTDPDHARVERVMSQWSKSYRQQPVAIQAEIDEVIARAPQSALAIEGRFIIARARVQKHLWGTGTPDRDAAQQVVDAFISAAPKDERGARMLNWIAQTYEDGTDRQLALYRRIKENYAGSLTDKLIEGGDRRVSRLGEPFKIAFTDVITGKEITMESLLGNVVVIDFWATWCGPCVAEMPRMKELYARYHDDGVEFIGVSLDYSEERGGLTALKKYVESNEIHWPQFYQGKGWEGEFNVLWGIRAIPTVFTVDQVGILRSINARGKLDTLIPELLAEAVDAPAARPAAVHGQSPQPTSRRIEVSANVLMSGDRPQTPLAEPHLAINPKDPNHLVAASIVGGFRGVALFVSFDGGDSWKSVRLKGLHDLAGFGDPWLAFDQKGTVYLVGLGRPSSAFVWRSSDGGLTWSQPVTVGEYFDHPSISVDGDGTIFVLASQSIRRDDGTVAQPVVLARSKDGGVTFEDSLKLSPTNLKYQAGMAAILLDGSVGFSYFDYATERTTSRNLRTRRIWFARLAENGQEYKLPAFVGEVTDFRNGFSPFAVDNSPTSPYSGRLYVASANLDSLDEGVIINELDASYLLDTKVGVLLNHSKDDGATWSRPHLVAQGFYETFNVNVAVNPQGVVAVAWMQRTDEADAGLEPYLTVSVDGGVTFAQAVRVSDAESVSDARVPGNIFEGFDVARRWPSGGDYFGLASDADGVFHIVWADSRTGVFQLWSAKITVK